MTAATTVKLDVPSEIRLVDLVHEASERMATLAGLPADEALNIGLAVRETVINAIKHGNGGDPTRRVSVTLTANAKEVRATIRDRGQGFDPGATPDPTDEENILRTSGRGLLLVRAFVDETSFRYREGKGMEVTLVKKIPPSAADRPEDGDARITRRSKG